MFDLEAGVVASPRPNGSFVVFCNRCNFDLGSMDLPTIRSAIFSTLGRGGVLCPDCRACACDVCGVEIGQENLCTIVGPKGDVRGCVTCALFVKKETERITQPLLNKRKETGVFLERALW